MWKWSPRAEQLKFLETSWLCLWLQVDHLWWVCVPFMVEMETLLAGRSQPVVAAWVSKRIRC